VTNFGGNTVRKLRAADGVLLGAFPVGTTPVGIAFDGANIWVTNGISNNITKLRAGDGVVLGTFQAGTGPNAIAFDGVNIWVTNFNTNIHYRTENKFWQSLG
jgi:DNA-binding beta-propeller fold protein YncE